jgi:glycosyltransferase involved in cell wall biosynthesis
MPAYNVAPYLIEAVNSLLNQTFKDFELWIIDDGSTDNTREVIKSFSDPRVKGFLFDENRGIVLVVNEVVKKISSDFFTITGADDISHPQRLQLQIEALRNDQELMMCGTSYAAVDERGFLFRELHLPTNYMDVYKQMPARCQFLGGTTIMRSSLINYFPEFYRLYFNDNIADSDLASRIVDQFKAVNLSPSLYYYRIVRTSLSRKNVTVRLLNLYKAIAFLSEQRRKSGEDSLMKGEPEKVDKFLVEISKEYTDDPSFVYRHTAFTHLYWKVIDGAWRNAFKALGANPFHAKNYFLFVYLATKSCYYFFADRITRMHYKTHFDKPLSIS